MEYLTIGIAIFFGINLINVVLSTLKSILTIKSTRMVAAIINALSYGFYALIVKSMASYEMSVVVGITIVANLIGVYFSMWLLEKFKKDKLWKVSVTVLDNKENMQIANDLYENDFSVAYSVVENKKGKLLVCDIYSKSQSESETLREILNKYEVKYHIAEVRNSL